MWAEVCVKRVQSDKGGWGRRGHWPSFNCLRFRCFRHHKWIFSSPNCPIAYSTKIGLVDNFSKIDDQHMMITAIWRRVICVYSVLYLRVVPLGWEVTLCTDEAMAKGGMVGMLGGVGGMKGYKEGQGDGSRQWKDYAGKELRGESKREGRASLPTANGKAYTLWSSSSLLSHLDHHDHFDLHHHDFDLLSILRWGKDFWSKFTSIWSRRRTSAGEIEIQNIVTINNQSSIYILNI